ncbi:MAG: imidazole glycerol phosphate synthase subunit HisF [Eubacteriaceae bacterium]|nr:imidazole glycerol phosphate synthase subunit HisF [Eubacteriaceae bacterium]
MLAKRIIPCLDVDQTRVVKGRKFMDVKDVADPVELAKRYSEQGADELVFYDITASVQNRSIFYGTLRSVADAIDIPFMIGGGIKTVEDFRIALLSGADKVSINSGAVQNPQVISEAKTRFGSQCIVLSIDAKRNGKSWDVYIKAGQENTGLDAIEWAMRGADLGAGELCINSIDMDGVKEGYDLELIATLCERLSIPVIASGGAGKMEHFAQAFRVGADAALAASVFHYDEIKIQELKAYLKDQGFEIR